MIGRKLLVAVVAAAGGCVGTDESATRAVVRDSAGVRIVESVQPALTGVSGWRVGDERIAIGIDDQIPGHELDRVTAAVRLSDGTIVIADAGSAEIRRYAPDGIWLGSSGGEGEGPGEFRALSWIGRSAEDSLVAWDRGLNRISVFTGSGEYVRAYQANLPETPMSQLVRGGLGDGRLLLSRGASFIPAEGEAGVQRQPLNGWLISTNGELGTVFGPFPGESVFLRSGRQAGSMIRTPVPFGGSTLIAAGGDRVFTADNGSYDIHVFTSDGQLVQRIRRPHEPLPVRPEDLAADIEARLAPLPPVAEIRAGSRASLEAVPPAEFIPAIRSMMVDSEGCLWIEAGRFFDASATTWSVFAHGGEWITDVELPAEMEMLEIGANYLLVRLQDEFDVESVRLLALTRLNQDFG